MYAERDLITAAVTEVEYARKENIGECAPEVKPQSDKRGAPLAGAPRSARGRNEEPGPMELGPGLSGVR